MDVQLRVDVADVGFHDGIKSCLWAGARMYEVHTAMVFDRVAVKPDEFCGAQTTGSLFWMGSNPWLKVNLNGERFANESGPYDYILNAALTQPHHTVVIWDSDCETTRTRTMRTRTRTCPRATAAAVR